MKIRYCAKESFLKDNFMAKEVSFMTEEIVTKDSTLKAKQME